MMLLFESTAAFATHLTYFWIVLSFITLMSCLVRFVTLLDTSYITNKFYAYESVNKHLLVFVGWGTVNRIVQCMFFLVYGVGRVFLISPSSNFTFNIVIAIGVITCNMVVLYANFTDRDRYIKMKSDLVSDYARDVDHGIQDAIERLGYSFLQSLHKSLPFVPKL